MVKGGARFIESQTEVELQQEGYEFLIIDDLRNSDSKLLDSITIITNCNPTYNKVKMLDKKILDKVLF